MKYSMFVSSLVGSCLLALSASGQTASRHTLELDALGRTTADLQTGPYTYSGISYSTLNGTHHEQVFGGALIGYSYALTPRLALEARGGFLFGHQPPVAQSGGRQVLFHAGIRATYPMGRSRFSFIARVEPGLASFSNAYRSAGTTITANPDGSVTIQIVPNYTRLTHFSLEEGVGFSARMSAHTAAHIDLGHETILSGDRSGALSFPAYVGDHFLFSAGMSRSFGGAVVPGAREQPPDPSTGKTEVVFSSALQPQLLLASRSLATTPGVAVTGSYFLRPWLALDASVVYLGGGDYPNYQDGGHETQAFAGVKLGFQQAKYGIFGKVRPGLASFGSTYQLVTSAGAAYNRSTDFALDAGAVLEFYPARHLVIRADLSEVFTFFGAKSVTFSSYQPAYSAQQPAIAIAGGQFLTGVGFRF